MDIKFLRGTMHLGYAYRAGDTTGSLPDEKAREFIASGYAIPVELKKRPEKPSVKKPAKAKVETTVIERKKKR
jgi:hypothetical protein